MYSLKSSFIALSLCSSGCLVACSFDGSNAGGDGGSIPIDATDSDVDSDADIDASQPQGPHLLLSEVRNRPGGKEFIEIYNPGELDISLDNYYIADTGDYLNLPATIAAPATPSQPNDFIVRFPAGNFIQAKEVILIGVGLREMGPMNDVLRTNYHIDPYDGFTGQEMLEAWTNSVRPDPTLTDGGEGIVLFHWDGISSLVSDVDMVIAGDDPSDNNRPPNKTGVVVTGPSGVPEAYAADVLTLPVMESDLSGKKSYQRIANEGVHETQNGVGNGISGHDETSENTSNTWVIADETPGTVQLSE